MTDSIQNFKVGDIIKVSQKIQEGKRERTISFKGRVLKTKGVGDQRMFTVRQTLEGVDVDRIYPLTSPVIEKIEVLERPKKRIRAANLKNRPLGK